MASKDERNYGIDLLRLVSMLYIVILHIINWGGMLNAAQTAAQANVMWLMDMWAFPAVNIFGMISGYVGYSDREKKHSLSPYIMTWLQVVFYGIAVTLVFQVLRPELVDLKDLIRVCFPVSNDLYWYFTAYTGLYFLMPLLNGGLRSLTEKQAKTLALGLFLIFSVFDSVVNRFGLNAGSSVLWLVVLYLLGGVMKKCSLGEKLPGWLAAAGIGVCMILPWLWITRGTAFSLGSILVQGSISESYTLPMHLAAATLYVLVFSRLRLGSMARKVISFAAPGAFAVYLLNCQHTIWWELLLDGFVGLGKKPVFVILIGSVGFAVAFVMGSVVTDWLRRKLFALLRIRKLVDTVVGAGEKLLMR